MCHCQSCRVTPQKVRLAIAIYTYSHDESERIFTVSLSVTSLLCSRFYFALSKYSRTKYQVAVLPARILPRIHSSSHERTAPNPVPDERQFELRPASVNTGRPALRAPAGLPLRRLRAQATSPVGQLSASSRPNRSFIHETMLLWLPCVGPACGLGTAPKPPVGRRRTPACVRL